MDHPKFTPTQIKIQIGFAAVVVTLLVFASVEIVWGHDPISPPAVDYCIRVPDGTGTHAGNGETENADGVPCPAPGCDLRCEHAHPVTSTATSTRSSGSAPTVTPTETPPYVITPNPSDGGPPVIVPRETATPTRVRRRSTPRSDDSEPEPPTSTPTPTETMPPLPPTSTPTPTEIAPPPPEPPTSTPTPTEIAPPPPEPPTKDSASDSLPKPTVMPRAKKPFSSDCLLQHAGAPLNLCESFDGKGWLLYYFGEQGRIETGPYVPKVGGFDDRVFLDTVSPTTNKTVIVKWIAGEQILRVATYYAWHPYAEHKAYVVDITPDDEVTYREW